MIVRLSVLALLMAAALAAWGLRAGDAHAHGEAGQEGFLRMRTISFWDVKFSTDAIKVGESVTITGKFTALEDWPSNLDEPTEAYLTALSPGARLVVEDRKINGVFTPGSFRLELGAMYEFEITMRGRRSGDLHLHPIIQVKGIGPLLGPGQWTQVGAGSFSNPTQLYNGKTVDLETYGLNRVVIWHVITLALGALWGGYWISKPFVKRFISVRAGEDEAKLITRRELAFSAVLGVATVATIAVGWLVTREQYPVTIPHQVIRVDIPRPEQPKRFVTVEATESRYDPSIDTLTMDVTVTNNGSTPVTIDEFTTSTLVFQNAELSPDAELRLISEPAGAIAPGETRTITLTMANEAWERTRLMDFQQPQLRVGGILIFRNAEGVRNVISVSPSLRPVFGGAHGADNDLTRTP